MEINNILKIYYFQKRALQAKGQVSGHPGHPSPRSAPVMIYIGLVDFVDFNI